MDLLFGVPNFLDLKDHCLWLDHFMLEAFHECSRTSS